jgi:hypothetical protein
VTGTIFQLKGGPRGRPSTGTSANTSRQAGNGNSALAGKAAATAGTLPLNKAECNSSVQ